MGYAIELNDEESKQVREEMLRRYKPKVGYITYPFIGGPLDGLKIAVKDMTFYPEASIAWVVDTREGFAQMFYEWSDVTCTAWKFRAVEELFDGLTPG